MNYTFGHRKSSLFGFRRKCRDGEIYLFLHTSSPALIGFTIAAGLAFWWTILG